MFKKVLVVIAVVSTAWAVRKQMVDSRAEHELWAEAVDPVGD